MTFGDFVAYTRMATVSLIVIALVGLLAMLLVAYLARRLTGRGNAVTRYFDGRPFDR